jgi:YVTN family beta-propeller protein
MRTTTRVPPREPRPNSSFVASLRARPGRGIAAAFIGALFVTFITLVALTPTGVPVVVPIALQQLWVANHPGTQVPGSTVARIDMTAERLEPAIHTGDLTSGLGTTPGGGDVLVCNRGANSLSIVDASSGRVVAAIQVGRSPDAVAVGFGRHRTLLAVVANALSADVTVVNLETHRIAATVRVGLFPSAVNIVPEGSHGAGLALVADYGSDDVTAIDLGTFRVRGVVHVGKFPNAIAVVPGGHGHAGVAAVTEAGSDAVIPVDLGTGFPLTPIHLPFSPTDVAANGDDTVWITEGSSVVPVDVIRQIVGPPIALPRQTQSIALDSSGTGAWVGEQGGVVQRVDLRSGALGPIISVGGLPQSMVITTTPPGGIPPP